MLAVLKTRDFAARFYEYHGNDSLVLVAAGFSLRVRVIATANTRLSPAATAFNKAMQSSRELLRIMVDTSKRLTKSMRFQSSVRCCKLKML